MRLLLAVFLTCLPCLAQTPSKRRAAPKPAASASQAWPLRNLKVTGNRLYNAQQIVAASGLKTGAPVGKSDFEAARQRLIDTGAFDTVGFQFGPTSDGKGVEGTFEVAEVEQVYPYRFEELPAADQQLRAFLREREPLFGEKIPGTKTVIERFATDLQSFLANTAFKDHVTARIVADKPGELSILFRPATAPPAVAEVQFIGAQALPASTLQNALAAVATGVPYREATIRQLLDATIRPLYDGRGRLRVNFTKIETERAKDVDGVRVKVQVEEGPVYNLGTVRSSVPELTEKQVLKMAALKSGEVANFDAVSAAIDKIQKELRKDGYMRSHTETERVIHDKEKTVDITFASTLGPLFRMGKLTIQGLDVISEPAIRKLWSMTPGKPFDADYPQMFLDRVKEDGYFDYLLATRFDQSINEKTNTVDVTLYFKGGIDPEKEREKERRRKREQQEGPPPFWRYSSERI